MSKSDVVTSEAMERGVFGRVLWFVGLVCSGLVLGLTLTHVLQAPGSRSLDGASWLDVQHTFYGGFAAVGGASEILGFLATAILSVMLIIRHRGAAAVAPTIAAFCLLGTLLSYWFGNRPANVKIAEWTASTLPPDWSIYRDSWEAAHAVSAVLGAVAFLALCVALMWRAPKSA